MSFAELSFNINLDQQFTYHIPPAMEDSVKKGMRVTAPFGKRILTGVITKISDISDIDKCKDIIDVLDDAVLITPEMLEFTKWISEYYHAPWGQCLNLAIPKGIEKRSQIRITLNEESDPESVKITERQKELFNIICQNPGKTTSYYSKKFGRGSFNHLLNKLADVKLIHKNFEIGKTTANKILKRYIFVPEDVGTRIEKAGEKNYKLDVLLEFRENEIPFNAFIKQSGLSNYMVNKLLKKDILIERKREILRIRDFEFSEQLKLIRLTDEQKNVLASVFESLNNKKFMVHLIHGVTGSGKTQVYLEAIKKVFQKGYSAIVLIPEISLTPQTVVRFKNYFFDHVTVFHSRMSPGERFDAWRKIYSEEKSIVVGPRSALFMPLKNLGIIIVDEEHDQSYKQSENAPRYNARDAAVYRAQMSGAVVLLGSATPSMESYYNSLKNKYILNKLKQRISEKKLPDVDIIDMRGIYRKNTSSKIMSPVLLEKIENRLKKKQQIILLQNRRGYSAFLQCTDCGYISRCPNCEVSLTFHKYNSKLVCHYCSYSRPADDECPKCKGIQIKYSGTGTQKIEQELHNIFEDIKILRMDQDTTRAKGAFDSILNSFSKGHADILLGTQMISKGLDFENVTLVGVVSGDVGLTLPDYRATERSFQLLTQVAGRAGRGKIEGEVIVQTFLPTHYAIRFAKNHDFTGFFREEMKNRKELFYPPFSRIINLKVIGADLSNTISTSREIAARFKKARGNLYEVIGPAPAPISKIKNQYRWHIFLKVNKQADPSGRRVNDLVKNKLKDYLYRRNQDMKIQIDVDPADLM